MKILGKLKLAAISAFVVLGMSSCLKTDDPDFAIGYDASATYILQNGSGSSARFTPCVMIMGNRPIKSASCTFEEAKFYFESVPNTNGYYMEIDPAMSMSSIDTISTGICRITATSAEETPASAQLSFSFGTVKAMGTFNVKELKYTGSGNVFTGKWNKVENAEAYYLMFKTQNSDTWMNAGKFNMTDGEEEMTGKVTIPFESGATFEVAVAAVNGALRLITGRTSITAGTDGGF